MNEANAAAVSSMMGILLIPFIPETADTLTVLTHRLLAVSKMKEK